LGQNFEQTRLPIKFHCFQLAERQVTSRLDLLKRNLNYADLLVIFVYVPSRACWLLTYDWRGGDLLCRVVKMMHTVAFQSSSNVIVCIALDRLFSVFSATRHSPDKANRRIRVMLAAAWTTAFVIGMPQLFVWRSYVPFQHLNWSQCLQMCYVMVLSWVFINSRPSISRKGKRTGSLQTGCETVDTVLTRASGRVTLFSFVLHPTDDQPPVTGPPRIVVSDESSLPLTSRPSIASSEASAVIRTSVHNSQSYHASVNRSRAVRVSFLLVVAYIVCWLPYNLLSLVHIIDSHLFANSFIKVGSCFLFLD
ncbi:7 transmembrane receptor, partial [Ancylostoma duodenale]